MVNRNKDLHQDDVEITADDELTDFKDSDLEADETNQKDIIGNLKEKLKTSETERRTLMEDMQRTKADFLNARKRLEDERMRDRGRSIIKHVEELVPLCDSFMMAMSDQAAWEKADPAWRKGVEGIYGQLKQIITKYQVEVIQPLGSVFDPYKHEALSSIPVSDKKEHDRIVSVLQPGYSITLGDSSTELIRPARVVIGVFEEK